MYHRTETNFDCSPLLLILKMLKEVNFDPKEDPQEAEAEAYKSFCYARSALDKSVAALTNKE